VENNLMAAKISKVVFRWANHCVGQAMVAWHKYTVEQLRKRNLMTRIVQCMQKRGAVVALEMWKWNVAGKATRDRIKKVEQSRISKVLMRGCDLWRDQTAKEKKLKAKALKVVRRRKSRGLSEGFQRWRDQTVEGTHFKKREKGVHSKALKLLSRLRYRNLILRWDIWHAAAWGRKHVKSTVSLIAQSMMQQSLKDHLLNWRSKAEKRATKLKIKASNFLLLQTSIAASHSQHRMVNRACLEAWSLQARCARQMANRALKIINRRTGAALAAGLHQWLDVVVAQKRARRQDNKREKLCTRWATRKCLAAWLVYRNKEARYRYIMRRIECRNACWIHSLCRESILSLRANADTLKRERAKDQQRSRLVTSKTLSRRHRYMLAWHVHMRTKVSRRLTIDRIDATRAKRVLARTVCVWLDEQVLESRQQNLFKRIVVKSIRRSLASVVGHWTNVLWSSKTERRRRNDWRIKVLGSNLRGWKAKPFEAWSSRSLQARCARQMANRALKIINRRTGAALAAGLHQWLGVVVAQKRARRQDNKREKLCTRWATRKCLAAWLVYRNKEARYRYIMRRIECRNACWIHSLCRESILSLRANADTLKRERAKDQQRSRLVTSKTLSRRHRYMLAWHVHMRTKVSRRLTIDRIDATRAKRVLARTVCVWLDEQVLESRQQNLFKRIVVKSIRRSLASVVGHWTNVLWSSKTERRRRNDWRIKVLGSNLRGWKAKPFEAWSSRSLQARCARQMANRALKIINRRTGAALAAGLHQWLGVVVAQKRARRQDNKREKLCTRWATRKCLAAWLVYRNKEARYRYIMRRIECRNACWIHSLCRESILSLRANADTLKRERAKDQQRSRLVTSKTLSRRHRYMLAWHVHMRTKVSRRLTIDRIDATRAKRVLARTVCVWLDEQVLESRQQNLFKRIVVKSIRRSLASVVGHWTNVLWSSKTERRRRNDWRIKVLGSNLRGWKAKPFEAWSSRSLQARCARQMANRALKIINRRTGAALAAGLHQWLGVVVAQKRARRQDNKREKLCTRWATRKCLAAWLVYRNKEARYRYIMRRIECRNACWIHSLCRESILSLRANADTLKRERAKDQQRSRLVTSKTLSRRHRYMLAWHVHMRTKVSRRLTIDRIDATRAKRVLARTVCVWLDEQVLESRQQNLFKRIVVKSIRRSLASVVGHWTNVLWSSKTERRRRNDWRIKVLGSNLRGWKAKPFEAWSSRSLQARCARQMANRALKIINRRTGAALAAGLHQWLGVVVAQKRARRQDNKREKLCTRWATRKCLAAWLVYRNKEARYRYIMRRIECRNACWIHSLCRESILSLRANADTLKRERAKDQQRSRLVTSKTLSRRHRYMLAWHVHTRTKVSRRLTIDRIDATRAKRVLARTVCVWLDEQVLESRQQNLFKRILVKSIRRSLASVVGHWTNVLWSSKTERRRRNDWRIKVLGSNLRGWKAKPFEAWSSRSLQARCARQMANRALKIINRRTGAALAAGLHQWLGVVVAQKRARRQDNKREKLCTRWATRKCLAAWLVYRNKEARYRYIMRRIECRNACWIHSLCRESILSLRANADTLKRERAKDQQRSRLVTSKTLSRRHGLLQGYFMSWSVDTEQVLRMACKTQWALCKCRRRSMGAYMLAWHVHMRTKVSRRRTIDRIDATRTKRVLARTVCVWMEARDRKRVLFRNIMTLLRNILCRCRMLFFRTWRGHSQLLKVGRLTSTAAYYGICDMMHHCSSTLLHQCLARWIEIMGMNAPDGSVMTVGYGVEVTTERSFEDLMLSEGEIRSFNEALLTGVCSSLEISRSCATVLCHQRGSVVATVILFAQDPGTSSTLRGEQVRVRAFLVVFMQRWVHASVHAEMGSRLNGREKLSYTRGITHSCECVWVYLSSVCRASKLARSFNVHGRHGRLPSNCLPAYECLEIPVS
jgi:hypothetical protein